MITKAGLIFLLFAASVSVASAQSKAVESSPLEVSGIVVHKDVTQEGSPVIFSIVADEMPGRYFKNFLKHLPEVGQSKKFPPRALRISIANDLQKSAADLEDIAVLDDRVVVLSEFSSKLFSEERLIADYSGIDALREKDGKRGLEGLAIRSMESGKSRVAVLWEGAHHKKKMPSAPILYVHELLSQDVQSNRPFVATKKNGELIPLSYSDLLALTGEADGTQFRAPALIWTQIADQKPGLIVLVTVDKEQSYYKKWLVRFDESGKPVGNAVPLTSLGMGLDLTSKNWEGMSWSADEKSIILVNDAKDGTFLFNAARPEGW